MTGLSAGEVDVVLIEALGQVLADLAEVGESRVRHGGSSRYGWGEHHQAAGGLSQNGLRSGVIRGQFASRRVQSWS